MIDNTRLLSALDKVRDDLLARRTGDGNWIGRLSSSALSTATAVSALSLVERNAPTDVKSGRFADEDRDWQLSHLILDGIQWLADHQNDDGGWGDTEESHSNIATTMLVIAAFRLTGVPADHADLLDRADVYVKKNGGVAGLRKRFGKDKTFAVPILANCALAESVSWKDVSPLPFELACLPRKLYRWAPMHVVSYAIPALVAVGQARFMHKPPWNPITRFTRRASLQRSLDVLVHMQPESGGYLEAIPLTSFVVMCLAGTRRADHPVTQKGLEFLVSTVRPDGSWPIDTNLATWNTSQSINALAAAGDEIGLDDDRCLDWLLRCQHRSTHPFTGAQPGGWGWSDLSGAVPDADDTAGALLALHHYWRNSRTSPVDRAEIEHAAAQGCRWLLDLQNADGGWPTFCRGWGKLPFDRSGVDLTAHALRALHTWRHLLVQEQTKTAINRGFQYLGQLQQADGSWTPLWFGNQDHPQQENPVYGTAKVLLAFRDFGRMNLPPAQRALQWLRSVQNADGGWSGAIVGPKNAAQAPPKSTVEETALAVEALVASDVHCPSVQLGLTWLVDAVERGWHHDASPIGLYFAKLWYHEQLYPIIFASSALGHAASRLAAEAHRRPASIATP